MRPAQEGFAGIPQEVRLLFRGLRQLPGIEVEGLIQSSRRRLSSGIPLKKSLFDLPLSQARRYGKFSNLIISLAEKPYRNFLDIISEYFERRAERIALQISVFSGFGRIKLSKFESFSFEDFTWRTFFSKSLPAADFQSVTSANHMVCTIPWDTLHKVGLASLNWRKTPKYPKIDTEGIDVFIGQTPYPARVSDNTRFVIRYHDAIPVFMPQTIPDKSLHQATHFYALTSNVATGAWFSCVSEATRQDLLKLFPEVEPRAVTIHNMVSHHYYPEESNYDRVPEIIRSRLYEGDVSKKFTAIPDFFSLREKENFYLKKLFSKKFRYLIIVSTIEPRKNHTRLLAAWEVIKSDIDPDLKLVIVGVLGWDTVNITKGFKSWIDRGDLFMISAVPAPDLRVLYRHAVATVCPSLGEGFDFSGVESMRSGGVTVASDIPVHREIYDDASLYFDPYSTASLVKVLRELIYSADSVSTQERLRARGEEVSRRYLPEAILPQWKSFIEKITNSPN